MGLRSPPDRRAALGDKRVLVVEDEAIVAMLVEDELREAGAEVVGPAASVGGALRLIEAAAKDGGLSAAVLDINLQGRAVAPVATGWPRSACRSCSPPATARAATPAGMRTRGCCTSRSTRTR